MAAPVPPAPPLGLFVPAPPVVFPPGPPQMRARLQWVDPCPFLQETRTANNSYLYAPRLKAPKGNLLESIFHDLSSTEEFPHKLMDGVPLALNAANCAQPTVQTQCWAYCWGIIDVLDVVTVNAPPGSHPWTRRLNVDLNSLWTPAAVQPNRAIGGLPRYRFIYFIHRHRHPSGDDRMATYSLTVYDREFQTTEWHDTGYGDPVDRARRITQAGNFWASATINLMQGGCPGIGALGAFHAGRSSYRRLYHNAHNNDPLKNARRTLLMCMAWGVDLARRANQVIPVAPVLGTLGDTIEDASGFNGLDTLFAVLFGILHGNAHDGVQFKGAWNFTGTPATLQAAGYGARVAACETWRNRINAALVGSPLTPRVAAGALTWQQALTS
ncbi:hypothetical protein JX265_012953 [Neoarthrinium moseri]|uniref:Uncharacterized protein n=1 Tax=Neoarthrinium moseri TaxID=1658444 RepID=A0A9Q0AJ92_9PEZI|nr:hypothetical protein JX266_013036 [Neoarthrinium moseri]KAI1852925.1 hypothetical protein JX265_012953 [Neoarthrinium moseri]